MSEGPTLDGYPTKQLETLIRQSKDRYRANVGKHGPGKNWLEDEARWHIWKACDELFQARDYANSGDYGGAMSHYGDALNHILFAAEITSLDHGR